MIAAARLLKLPMYQVVWNGIRLEDIAGALGVPVAQLAGRDFYREFYRKMSAQGFALGADWLGEKAAASRRLRAVLEAADPLWREHGRVALSVGAGLGVLEIPLIEAGYRIHLQEVQGESLHYFTTHSAVPAEKVFITPTLAEIPSDAYDAVYLSQLVYAFDDKTYRAVLADAFRILRPGGTLAIWDPPCQLMGFYARLRSRGRASGVFWGWTRSRWLHARFARAAGFTVARETNLSADGVPLADAKTWFGCTVPGTAAGTFELILTKPGSMDVN